MDTAIKVSPRPLFVVFEGIDGAGTTTQSSLLAQLLEDRGHFPVMTREPGGTRIGERIRSLLLDPALGELAPVTELLLYSASRAQHVNELILPALNEGKPVISDRFALSTMVYQGAGRGIVNSTIDVLENITVRKCLPDVSVIIDLPVKIAFKRQEGRKKDRLEQEEENFHNRVAQAYRAAAANHPNESLLVDGSMGANELAEHIYLELCTRWQNFPFDTK